jgi:hypothetical protein
MYGRVAQGKVRVRQAREKARGWYAEDAAVRGELAGKEAGHGFEGTGPRQAHAERV